MISPKIVMKPWGHESWLADGVRTPYASKKIFFMQGRQTSLQVHEVKFETNYVLEGYGALLLSPTFFDVQRYIKGEMSEQEVADYIANMETYQLGPNSLFDVPPGRLHRVRAITDLTFMETSTPQLDDVVRILDDTNRPNGRIETEHRR